MNGSKTTNSWQTPIDKLMIWRGNWTKYDAKLSNLFLRVVHDQLLVTADTKILESFNMHYKTKGIYKNDVLILIVNGSSNEIRKIKFQLKSNLSQCIRVLSNHFPIVNYDAMNSSQVINSKYRNIDEVLKHALIKGNSNGPVNLPTAFENFVKLCILDPTFPQMVIETEKILNIQNS